MNAIFCSAGRRVELLRAFKRAYRQLDLAGHLVALDIDPLAPALQVADRQYLVPRLHDPGFAAAFLDICEREAPALVFPLIDPDVPVLASLKNDIESRGGHLAGVGADAAALAEDKWKTMSFFADLGLHTPRSWLPDASPREQRFPLFVKPRRGSAGQHAHQVAAPEWLPLVLSSVPDPIIQDYVSAPEVTSDVVCDLDGNVLAVVSRQRLEVRSGEVSKGVTIRDRRIEDACISIAAGLDARGPITVQCFLTEDGPLFLEINARLGGGFPLGVAAGAESPTWLLARVAGLSVDVPPIGTYRTGVYMTRYDDSFILEGDTLTRAHDVSV